MYTFKFWQEAGWAVLIAVVLAAAQILQDFEPETITDWRTWAVAGAGAIARSVGVALMKVFGRSRLPNGQDDSLTT